MRYILYIKALSTLLPSVLAAAGAAGLEGNCPVNSSWGVDILATAAGRVLVLAAGNNDVMVALVEVVA